jgi:hypothetical protein
MVGRILAALGVVALIAVCISICNLLSRIGHSELIGPIVVEFVGAIISWLGACLIIGTAFEEGTSQGLCCIFVPVYFLFYGFRNCQEGLGVWAVGFVITLAVRLTVLSDAAENKVANAPPIDAPPFGNPNHNFFPPQRFPRPNVPAAPSEPIEPIKPAVPTETSAPAEPATPANPAFPPASPNLNPFAGPRAGSGRRFGSPESVPGSPSPADQVKLLGPKAFRGYVAKNYSDWIGDDNRLIHEMRWLPVAKRPALAVRWAVGVTMPSMTPRKMIRQVDELYVLTGPVGVELVRALVARIDSKIDGRWSEEPAGMLKVPVVSAESEDQLIGIAARMNVDAMALISLSVQRIGLAKMPRAIMVVRLVDVPAHKATWSSAELNSQKAKATLGTVEDANALLLKSVLAKLDADYRLSPVPKLGDDVVHKRANRLAAGFTAAETMLRTLAELRYYQASKLIEPGDARQCFKNLVGEAVAEALSGADPQARAQAVDDWFQSQATPEFLGFSELD